MKEEAIVFVGHPVAVKNMGSQLYTWMIRNSIMQLAS